MISITKQKWLFLAIIISITAIIIFTTIITSVQAPDVDNQQSNTGEASDTFAFADQSDVSDTVSRSEEESSMEPEDESSEPEILFPEVPMLDAKSVFLCDMEGNEIFSHNPDRVSSPASLTKLVTASVVLEHMSVDTVVTVGREVNMIEPDSSIASLAAGNRHTVYELLAGLLICSGNDAAYVLAVATARTVHDEELSEQEALEKFCDMMNEFAAEIGMENSYFGSPDGYDASGQHTTARDMALIAGYCYRNDTIRELCSTALFFTDPVRGRETVWRNSNAFLIRESEFFNEYVLGMKTGTTSTAGKCLISVYSKDGVEVIAVVMGCTDDGDRYTDSITLFEYAEEFYSLNVSLVQ